MSLLDRAYRSPRLRQAAKRCLPALLPALPRALRTRVRLALEQVIYRNTPAVHALPDAFHHWSERYLRPRIARHGFESAEAFYTRFIAGLPARDARRPLRVVSLGSGAAAMELAVWRALASRGIDSSWECVELNADLQRSAAAAAVQAGAAHRFRFRTCSVEDWTPGAEADAVIANQFLHHVEDVDALLQRLRQLLAPRGRLVTHDVIGRNGHRLWPAALAVVEALWPGLPDSRKRDAAGRPVEPYRDHDCAAYSLEGIDAQRILPALLEHFHTRFFFGYAGMATAFLDRRFGHGFDPGDPHDRAFIERLGALDWDLLERGLLAPTQMFGVFCRDMARQGAPFWNLDPRRALAARGVAPVAALAAFRNHAARAAP